MLGVHRPIRIRCRDEGASSMKQIDGSRVMVGGRLAAMASNMDRKPKFRISCGSIQLLMGSALSQRLSAQISIILSPSFLTWRTQ